MGVHGLEPWTSSLSGTRSNQTELHARKIWLVNQPPDFNGIRNKLLKNTGRAWTRTMDLVLIRDAL